jgi:hypothetical protein
VALLFLNPMRRTVEIGRSLLRGSHWRGACLGCNRSDVRLREEKSSTVVEQVWEERRWDTIDWDRSGSTMQPKVDGTSGRSICT